MRTIVILAVFSLFLSWSKAHSQTVTSITDIVAEQDSDKINIFYRIPSSKQGELFNIKISASIDHGAQIPLRYVSGDVGANIAGGKSRYKITWDALKELSKIGSAEFFITADKVSMAQKVHPSVKPPLGTAAPTTIKSPRKRKWLIAADATYDSHYGDWYGGFRLAFYKKWGACLNFSGNRVVAGPVFSFNYPSSSNLSMYLAPGIFYYEEYFYSNVTGSSYYYESINFGAETGLILSLDWFALSLGLGLDAIEAVPHPAFAIGIKF